MLNLLTSNQIREADSYTIDNRPISSLDLMKSASKAFVDALFGEMPYVNTSISIYCGTGNNGGDGLAIARLLKSHGYDDLSVKIVRFNAKTSPGFDANLKRLEGTNIALSEIKNTDFPDEKADIIIDALLGSGLNKPLSGNWKSLVDHINSLNSRIIAVDVPTGFSFEGPIDLSSTVLKASVAITFQRPKINFFFPESENALNRFEVADIGLDEEFIQSRDSGFKLIERTDIHRILKPKKPFSHKGTYGHALILAGTDETMGAALLCAEACLNTGTGLTTACIPVGGLTALNSRVPEVMAAVRDKQSKLKALGKYSSVAIGPGLGTDKAAKDLLSDLLGGFSKPIVLDADALNILAKETNLLKKLPDGSILTPHMKEFDRLFGGHNNWWDRVETARHRASELNIIIVLKNRFTFIASPDKQIYINPTGSPAMATGGMGDVLTGMIVSFLAQGYTPLESAQLACYIHGLCGTRRNRYVVIASGLIKLIPRTISNLLIE